MIALIGCPTEDDNKPQVDPPSTASVSVSIGSGNVNTVSVSEGGTVTATVTLDSALDSEATFTLMLGTTAATDDVNADVDGADSDDDATFSGDSNTAEVSIATGVLTGSAEITIVDDDAREEAEDNETFTVGLTAGPTGVTLSEAVATITISRNDQAMSTQVTSFSASSGSVSEGGGPATITIGLDGPAITPLSFGYTIGGVDAADIDDDDDDADGDALSGTIDVALGEQSGTATITIADDALIEGDETMTVTLASSNAPLPIAGSIVPITLTIGDNDALSVELAATTYRFKEGDTETDFGRDDLADVATIVMLSVFGGELVGSAAEVSLTTVAGTATTDDFTARSGADAAVPIPVADYTTEQTISVPLAITDDAIVEIDETFRLELSESDPRVGVGTANEATVTIVERFNNGLDIVEVTWMLDRVTAEEGSAIETTIELASGSFGFDADFHMVLEEFVEIPALDEEGRAADVDGIDDNDDAVFSMGSTMDTITIPAGGSINTGAIINITDDPTEEDEEVFSVGLRLSERLNREIRGNSISLLGPPVREVTIPRNDQAIATQVNGFTATPPTIGEDGGDVTIAIVLDGEAQSPLSFGYAISGIAEADIVDDDADSDGDALTGTIDVAQTNEMGMATIAIADDALIEGDETMTITIGTLPTDSGSGNMLDYATGINGEEEVTITDDDMATVSIEATTATAVEGGADGEFTVSLTGDTTTAAVVVPLDIGGDAAVGDYTLSVNSTELTVSAGSTSLTIPSGATSAPITVAAASDGDVTDETLTLTIGTGITGGGRVGAVTLTPTEADQSASVTLQDDDYNAIVSGTSGTIGGTEDSFTISLNKPVSAGETVTITYRLSGSATVGVDYQPPTGYMSGSGSVTITAPEQTETVNVDITPDSDIEPNETVSLTITGGSAPGGGSVFVGSPATATITITDDDEATVSIATTTDTAVEGGAIGAVTVRLTGDTTTAAVVVPITLAITDGDTPADDDYTLSVNSTELIVSAGSTSLTIPSGATSATITVTAASDDDVTDETLTLTIGTGITGGGRVGAVTLTDTIGDRSASVTLQDDDYSVTVSPPSTAAEQDPGDGGITVDVSTIALNRPVSTGETVTITYRLSGSATVGEDYQTPPGYMSGSGSVTIEANAQTAMVLVAVRNDDDIEGDETVILEITGGSVAGGSGSVVLGDPATAEIIITDNDMLMAAFAETAFSVNEGSSTTNVELIVSGGDWGSSTIRFNLAATGVTATSGVDFTPINNFAIGGGGYETERRVSVPLPLPISPDNLVEIDETFTLTLSTSESTSDPRIIEVGAQDSTTITIVDDDTTTASIAVNGVLGATSIVEGMATVEVSVGPKPLTVAANFVVTLIATPETTDTDATLPDDASLPGRSTSATATITPPASSVSIALSTDDNLIEGTRTDISPTQGYNIGNTVETFAITLALPTIPTGLQAGDIMIDPIQPTVTIMDNDRLTVEFVSSTYSVTEGVGTNSPAAPPAVLDHPITMGLRVSGGQLLAAAEIHVVPSTTGPGDTTQSTDVSVGTNRRIILPARLYTPSQVISMILRIVDDTEDDDNETFTINLVVGTGLIAGGPQDPRIMIGTPNEATVTIIDNDPTP